MFPTVMSLLYIYIPVVSLLSFPIQPFGAAHILQLT